RPAMRTSTTRHPFCVGSYCPRKSSADENPFAIRPLWLTRADTDSRAAASSSTTKTVASLFITRRRHVKESKTPVTSQSNSHRLRGCVMSPLLLSPSGGRHRHTSPFTDDSTRVPRARLVRIAAKSNYHGTYAEPLCQNFLDRHLA